MDKIPIMTNPGTPAHVPTEETRQKVIDLSCNGFSQLDIADYLDIDDKTLRKHYKVELGNAKKDKTIKLGNSLYNDALAGDKQAREFWLKTQGRWSYAKPQEESSIGEQIGKTILEQLHTPKS